MKLHRALLLTLLLIILLLTFVITASADGGRRITWYVISSGGGHTSSSHYTLDSTVGQQGPGLSYSAHFQLGSGFWYIVGMPEVNRVFLPVVLKS